jgi:cyclopropane-fatty-acyl-phospholipid synthase
VEARDYRDLEKAGAFDKIASVGMAEHVGAEQLQKYFAHMWKLLRLSGTFFNSCISRPVDGPGNRVGSFTEAYVFPDGELVPIHEILAAAEMAGFEVCST